MENNVYGQCPHGENMVTCCQCNPREIEIAVYKNDPKYCYFIEHWSGRWLNESGGMTKDPSKAVMFGGDEGRVTAKLYLRLNQSEGRLKSFSVKGYRFVKSKHSLPSHRGI